MPSLLVSRYLGGGKLQSTAPRLAAHGGRCAVGGSSSCPPPQANFNVGFNVGFLKSMGQYQTYLGDIIWTTQHVPTNRNLETNQKVIEGTPVRPCRLVSKRWVYDVRSSSSPVWLNPVLQIATVLLGVAPVSLRRSGLVHMWRLQGPSCDSQFFFCLAPASSL